MPTDRPEVRGQTAGGDDATMWARAFPAAVQSDARAATAALRAARLDPSGSFQAVVSGGPVEIPYRIYNPPPDADLIAGLTDRQRELLDAMLTRHHDGFLRQDSVVRLLPIADAWTIPFVVHLIGEYVVEIVAVIADELVDGDPRLAGYRAFAQEDKAFVSLIRERAVSYWNCNYRARWATFDDYPARALLDRLGYRRHS